LFATLLGSLPRPPLPTDATPVELLTAVVRAQEDAGLEPITDAGFGIGDTAVERWRATAAMTDRPVKQTLIGPYTATTTSSVGADDNATRSARALRAADTLRTELLALVAAGCPFIEIHEPAAIDIGAHQDSRARFRAAHLRLLSGVAGPHLSLAITGGSADAAGVDTLLSAPYASLAVDLIAGPDNWRLVAKVPGDRGIICGALSADRADDDRPEVLLWAAGYAASTGGRGPARVGLGTASSLADLPWDVAVRKLALLGEAVRLADLPADERRRHLDPRSVDIRSAALGRVMPREPVRRRPRRT
jgi:methionine synthase II (cobalamin-independent)